jgi:hypothetical protein
MKNEYDFSKGQRRKFYRPDVELNIPIYLDPDVANVVQQRAKREKTSVATVVNAWLGRDIEALNQSRKLKAR